MYLITLHRCKGTIKITCSGCWSILLADVGLSDSVRTLTINYIHSRSDNLISQYIDMRAFSIKTVYQSGSTALMEPAASSVACTHASISMKLMEEFICKTDGWISFRVAAWNSFETEGTALISQENIIYEGKKITALYPETSVTICRFVRVPSPHF